VTKIINCAINAIKKVNHSTALVANTLPELISEAPQCS